MKKIESNMRRAIEKYNLIDDGDKVAVGLSGGKDSLALLLGLSNMRKYLPQKFELCAILIDNGNPTNKFDDLQKFCNEQNVKLEIVHSDIFSVVFDVRKEKNPCALCAKMRRGLLCTTAKQLGCNKLALGHHADDLIDTFFLSLIYEGRLSTFAPKSFLDQTGITVIRPLLLSFEAEIEKATHNLPIQKNPCPANKKTKREEMKLLVENLTKKYNTSRENLFRAITEKDRYNLF